jgi:coproporphyrinogen III oxidase-like Fe-S oxidoreductase
MEVVMSNQQIVWDQEIIEKYNYSGPRYTSYPTALEFHEAYTPAEFDMACTQYPDRPLSLYIHIPFCHKLCYFCGCNKVITRHHHKADIYLDSLELEIRQRAALFTERKVTQLHFGGGTPTFLTKIQFTRLMNLLRGEFNFEEGAEISIEVDGLPKQSAKSLALTIKRVLEMEPGRLSVFNYAHMPTLFAAQRKIKDADLPAPAEKLIMLQETIENLTGAGYQFIGMDHFALPDDELAVAQREGILHRNFQGYTTQGECDLLGMGVSAISMIGDSYAQNKKDLKEYYAQVDEKRHALWRGVALDQDDLIRREVIKQLICNFTLDTKAIEAEFNLDFDTYFAEDIKLLQTFINDELVTMHEGRIDVELRGRLLIRNICMCFDKYLRSRARQQQFSRVI